MQKWKGFESYCNCLGGTDKYTVIFEKRDTLKDTIAENKFNIYNSTSELEYATIKFNTFVYIIHFDKDAQILIHDKFLELKKKLSRSGYAGF